MRIPQNPKWKIAARLACLALLTAAISAPAALTVTTTNQQGVLNTWPFTPSWTVATNSLLAGVVPTTVLGNFSQEVAGRSASSLTVNTNLQLRIIQPSTSTDTNYVTCGNNGGSLIVYTLPAGPANGYDLTNIVVYGGWANNGRDAQNFNVFYSTVANPGSFKYLTTVTYNPSVPNNTASATRETIADSFGGVIAANVAVLKFDFSFPSVENGYTGYGAITVGGNPAATVTAPVISVTTSNQSNPAAFTPTWPVETPSIIAGLAPATAVGTFNQESSGGTPILTDGALGQSGDVSGFATCGTSGGQTLIYAMPNTVNGSDVTNIVVYSGWGNANRDAQYYTVSYATIAAPLRFVPITTVYYNPTGVSGASANRVAINMSTGVPLATGIAFLKFDFASPPGAGQIDNAYSGVSEIVVQGSDSTFSAPLLTQDTLPSYAETIVGDQVIFTAAFSNSPAVSTQWLFVNNAGVTNVISGQTTSTLTLNTVQLTDSGSYMLRAVNATNSSLVTYSSPAPLVVSSTPAAVNNIILNFASQAGGGTSVSNPDFIPSWTINTNNDLILGFPTDGSGNPGTASAGTGNYGLGSTYGDPTVLTDGSFGRLHIPASGGNLDLVSCGSSGEGPGSSMTYTLNTASAPNGFDLTNITVYGGWVDGGRNEQKYEIKYSTTGSPTTFNSLGIFDYNPNDPSGFQSFTRVSLVPATGVLAQNVAAVQINWGIQAAPPKNGWEGYSEIIVKGALSAPKPVLTQDVNPVTAEDVVGSSLTLTANFSAATSLQWQKNGVNIPGATTATLTLSPLLATDTATNGGYRLTALNGAGTSVSRGCVVKIDPAPLAVNNIVTAYALQTSDVGSFTPTWDTSLFGSSLINGASPSSSGTGNFLDPDGNPISHNLAGGLPVLTDGGYGAVVDGGPHPAFATGGPNAGQFVIYSMPGSSFGYDLTNILISSGWNDAGRDEVLATVSYSTVAAPTSFLPLVIVSNNPTVSIKSVIRATVTPGSGILASNVAAVKFDFTLPAGIENGYAGFSQINVYGSQSASQDPKPVITTENQTGLSTPPWTVESPNLIAGQLPSSFGPGVFTSEGCNVTNLTDGIIGFGANFGASCGDDGITVPWITFDSAYGWNITNIVVYTLWSDYGRDGQFYNVSYSTMSNPTTFLPLASVIFNPDIPTGITSGNRVSIAPPLGQTMLATNVAAIRFDFTPQGSQDFGWSGYSEIVVQGTNLTSTVPVSPILAAPRVLGNNLIVTGTGGTPNRSYTWQSTTNLNNPANWITATNGFLSGSGSFSNALPVDPSQPARFFRFRLP